MGSSRDREFRTWGLRDGEFRIWGVHEMGSSGDGDFSRLGVQELSYKGLTRAVFCVAKAQDTKDAASQRLSCL